MEEWQNFLDNSTKQRHFKGYYVHNHQYNVQKDIYYHRPSQRRIIAREYIQFAPVQIGYGIMLKICILAIILMCVFTYNLGTFNQIDYPIGQKITSTTNIQYSPNYKFIDEYNPVISRLTNCANAIEIYGKSTSWLTIANNMTSSTAKNTLGVITNAILLPFNFILNTATLGYNIYNALTGSTTLIEPKYKAPIDIIWLRPDWASNIQWFNIVGD